MQNIFLKIWTNHEAQEIENVETFIRHSVRNGVFNYLDSLKIKHKYFEPFRQINLEELKDMNASTSLNEKELMLLILSW